MSPSAMPTGVWTKLLYRKPPPTEEFVNTAIDLYCTVKNAADEQEVFVRDVRSDTDEFTIEHDGLEFMKDPVDIKDWDDEAEVYEVLRRETTELIKRRLGATRVFINTARIRRSDPNGQKLDSTPLFVIHADSTPPYGVKTLLESVPKMDPPPRKLPPTSRVVLVNVWRPLKTVKQHPIAFLNPNSIRAENRHSQLFEGPVEKDRNLANFWLDTASYNNQHDWVFLRHQEPDEPVMFIQWDSDSMTKKFESRMSIYHTSFENPDYVNGPGRASIEIKAYAYFDD